MITITREEAENFLPCCIGGIYELFYVAPGPEQAFGVGCQRDVFGEPEDGEDDVLNAAGVGGKLVEGVDDDDVIAGAVDDEVARQRHTFHVGELVEEALSGFFVDVEVVDSMCDGLAEEIGVGDEVGEVDGVAGFQVNGQEASRMQAMGGTKGKTLLMDGEDR